MGNDVKVKLLSDMYVYGAVHLTGDIVEVTPEDARFLIAVELAVLVTEGE